MRTTIDISEDLLKEAMKVTHAKTKTMTITLGLQELIHKARMRQLLNLKGKIDLNLDLKETRQR